MIIQTKFLSYNYTEDSGLIHTSKRNSASGITRKGVSYSKRLIDIHLLKYEVVSFAGASFQEVINAMKKKMIENPTKTVISYSLFDKTLQDWSSDFYRLGFGGTIYLSQKKLEGKELFDLDIESAELTLGKS